MKTDYLVYGLLAVVTAILVYSVAGLMNGGNATGTSAVQEKGNAGFRTISSGSTEPGSAQIDLTPKGIVNGKLGIDFAVNTHSVELSQYDLAKTTVLEYNGRKILPTAAPKLEGHHSSGTLIFNVGESLNNFKIIIRGIPDVEERVFEWS